MKKVSRVIWGLVLVAVGVVLALNAFGVTNIEILFDGWWTLFLIFPCAVSLFTEKDKLNSLLGILFGVFLLLCARDVLDFSMLWKLLLHRSMPLVMPASCCAFSDRTGSGSACYLPILCPGA